MNVKCHKKLNVGLYYANNRAYYKCLSVAMQSAINSVNICNKVLTSKSQWIKMLEINKYDRLMTHCKILMKIDETLCLTKRQ